MTTPTRASLGAHRPLLVALAGTLLLAAAMGIGRFAYTPLLPDLRETLGWTVAQAGDVASANFLGYWVGALLASLLVHRPGRRGWLLLGMIGSVLTTALGAWAEAFAPWLAIRFLSGVASALCLVIGTAVIVEALLRRRRPELTALHFAGVGLGIVASVLVVESVRYAQGTVFGQWGALGLASAVMMAATAWVIRTIPVVAPSAEGPTATDGGQATARSGALMRAIVAYGLFGFGYVVTATFIVAMARRLDSAGLVEPAIWIVVGLLAAPSTLAWQWAAGRHGLFSALRAAFLVEAAGVLLAGFGTGYVALLVGGALLGATFMGITALGLVAGRSLAGRHPDRVIAWMTAAFGFGQLLGPAVAGRLAETTGGFAVPSVVAAACLILGAGLLWNIGQR